MAKITLEQVEKKLIDLGYRSHIKKMINPPSLILIFKNAAKICISLGRRFFNDGESFRVKCYVRTKYGGYRLVNDKLSTNATLHNKQLFIKDLESLIKIVQYFAHLPPITNKEKKPKDDKNLILQNAIARVIQEKVGGKVTKLARADKDFCNIALKFAFIRIRMNRISIDWHTLKENKETETIAFEPHTFNPMKIIDAIVSLNQSLVAIQNELEGLNKYFDKIK